MTENEPKNVATATEERSKVKTKAKLRYLRRKKERRKQRKVSAPKSAPKSRQSVAGSVGQEPEESAEEGSEEDVHQSSEESATEEVQVDDPESAKDKIKPRKRRKLAQSVQPEDHLQTISPSEVNKHSPQRTFDALPSFPPPVLPNLPSKHDLVLQGVDQGLLDAEIVDAATLLPISAEGEEDSATGLSQRTRRRLVELGINELFAVQTALLPFLLPPGATPRALYLPYDPPRDVCVSAPTGSGKTLAYVLPIIEVLSARVVTRLRALVVLPTRDLVAQVRETFEVIGKGRGLKIGTANGQHSFAHEQAQLVGDDSIRLQGGLSKVDVLICTPGRLIDHLNGTPNFSLQHLRFLVIDEADRLLAQSYQDWLAQVLLAIRAPTDSRRPTNPTSTAAYPYPDAMSPAFLPDSLVRADIDEKKQVSCQKLLFSATLTKDPGKIAALELRDSKYFVVQSGGRNVKDGIMGIVMEKFTFPASLTEYMITCDTQQKPLMLFHLVHDKDIVNALVFTKSAESTSRLVKLFEYFEDARVESGRESKRIVIRAYSSDLGASDRRVILEQFKAKEVQILVCSDLISRGIDISHVSHVVSYDVPVDVRKYVHRVGRTARAGRAGSAWTLVESQEARHFKSMLKDADHWEQVKRVRVSDKALAPMASSYETALARLKEAYART